MSEGAPSLRARQILRNRTVDVLPDAARVSAAHDQNDAFFGGLLEAAFLVASADGSLSKEEVGSLIDVVSDLGGEGVTPAELAGMVYEFSSAMEKEGRQARPDALAAAVTDDAARREILGFASLIALCDHDLAPSELFVLHSLGKVFGFDATTVNGVIRSVKGALGDGEPAGEPALVPMRDRADVVVVGAGIMGLSIAYNLAARHGVSRVTVVDQSYLCGGASGRNGGGVRAQWSTEANVRLMQESLRICSEFASAMKINVWFRQGGYLFVARDAQKRRALEDSVKVQNEAGIGTRMLTPQEARRIVPELDVSGVEAASYNPNDAVVFPWPFVWGYAEGARKLGVEIATHTKVLAIRTQGSRITGVVTDRGDVATNTVVNAAGAWSPEIARLVGVSLPNKPHRHEICSTEPLKPWLGPLVADLGSGLYFSQSTRGEIVGGISNEHVPPGLDMGSSHDFLRLYAKALVRAVPLLARVKVLRQWAGCYDLTPDANPIVGEVDEVERFFQASGFMGHGFMMAPVIGRLLAQRIAEGSDLPLFERWALRRFKEGRLLSEAMIIG